MARFVRALWAPNRCRLPSLDSIADCKLGSGNTRVSITASYYIDAPTNDTYFWPEAVQRILDAIPSNKNHSFNPNRNHSQANSKSRYQWMVHYLKGGDLPGFAEPTLVSAPL